MFAGDYNGWTDVPEDEREALDALDFTLMRRLERRRRSRVTPAARNPTSPSYTPRHHQGIARRAAA
jgi:hypothetical protein